MNFPCFVLEYSLKKVVFNVILCRVILALYSSYLTLLGCWLYSFAPIIDYTYTHGTSFICRLLATPITLGIELSVSYFSLLSGERRFPTFFFTFFFFAAFLVLSLLGFFFFFTKVGFLCLGFRPST